MRTLFSSRLLSGLLSILLVASAANAWTPAAQTTTTSALQDAGDDSRESGDGLSLWLPPEPTVGPELWHGDLVKRAGYYNTPNDLCGYAEGLRTESLTCSGNGLNYCGYNSDIGLFGCCRTYFTTNHQYSLSGCTFPTRCWDSTAVAARCNEACLLNPRVVKCTDDSNPYCIVYSITNNGLLALGCSTASMTVPVAEFIGATGSSRIPTSSAGDLTSSSSPPAAGSSSSSSITTAPVSGPVSSNPSSMPSSTPMPPSTYSFSSTPTTPHLNPMPASRSQMMAGSSSDMPQVTISGGTGAAGGGRVDELRGACFVLSVDCALLLLWM